LFGNKKLPCWEFFVGVASERKILLTQSLAAVRITKVHFEFPVEGPLVSVLPGESGLEQEIVMPYCSSMDTNTFASYSLPLSEWKMVDLGLSQYY
jgi:hypothetical protein